jgi:hypothetical protein
VLSGSGKKQDAFDNIVILEPKNPKYFMVASGIVSPKINTMQNSGQGSSKATRERKLRDPECGSLTFGGGADFISNSLEYDHPVF